MSAVNDVIIQANLKDCEYLSGYQQPGSATSDRTLIFLRWFALSSPSMIFCVISRNCKVIRILQPKGIVVPRFEGSSLCVRRSGHVMSSTNTYVGFTAGHRWSHCQTMSLRV
jgi:hypothetical protein